MSLEHVWSRWLRAYPAYEAYSAAFEGAPRVSFERLGIALDAEGRVRFPSRGTQREIPIPDVTVKVCQSCNNGWMSALEADTKKVLEDLGFLGAGDTARPPGPPTGRRSPHASVPVFSPVGRSLTSTEVVVLARWATKTAFTLSLTFADHHQCLDDRLLGALRDAGVPDNVRIWAGWSSSPQAQVGMDLFPALLTKGAATDVELSDRATVAGAWVAAHGVVFVIHWSRLDDFPLAAADLSNRFGGWLQLWPPRPGHAVVLPSRPLHDAELRAGLERMSRLLDRLGYPVVGLRADERADAFARLRRRNRAVRVALTPVRPVLALMSRPLASITSRVLEREMNRGSGRDRVEDDGGSRVLPAKQRDRPHG